MIDDWPAPDNDTPTAAPPQSEASGVGGPFETGVSGVGGVAEDWTSRERWAELADGSPASLAVRAELLARWSEPHRRYHTRTHLAAVLAAVEPLATEAEDATAVRLAAWFHDAVYDGRPGWDEERSAQLAQSRLPGCGVPAGRVATVARLVRLTAAHDTLGPGDHDGAVLCDADLAILASPAYPAYAHAIRQEYAHVPDPAFARGRSQVLRRLLATPSLYRTPRARELWEAPARTNMTAELATLTTD
ncbi:HD domain-containing protein [Nonomuraea sp. KM90]|uniref:HD domain-containing protein n=1 Tax=Nonomuraea sp. KM90 TaxID=3457428 RepID=UPI003FCE1B23